MNINDEEIDLRLALGSRSYSAETRLNNSSSGAGANANSRVDMPFAASDPLSELVWSPHSGLSLRCANSRLAENRPFANWELGETAKEVSISGSGDIKLSDVAVSPKVLGGDCSSSGFGSRQRNFDASTMEEAGTTDAVQEKKREEDLGSSQNAPTADIAESSKRSAEQDIAPPTLVRLEYFDETDPCRLTAKETCCLGKRAREKGKEKALSDGDIYGKSSKDDEDDSHESVESCTSARILSKGIKRQHYDQGESTESKRIRKQIEGSNGATSFVKRDSSFMNWISNMVKGLSDCKKEEAAPMALTFAPSDSHRKSLTCNRTPDCTAPITGFQTVFQSLYNRSNKASDDGVQKMDAESGELIVADEKSLENLPLDGSGDDSCKQIIISDKIADSTAEKTTPEIPLPVSCMPVKGSPLSSLWITRLYTRTSTLGNFNQITEDARDCSSGSPNANLDNRANDVLSIDQKILGAKDACAGDEVRTSEQAMQSSPPKVTPIQSSQKLANSETMLSVFAKRLGALRHIIHTSEKKKCSSSQLKCFFCGGNGHDLRICPELTETELENILFKINSFEKVEESSCFCIRCFQLDHWAISCPFVSSDDHKRVVSGQVVCSKKPVWGSFPAYLTWDVKESSRNRLPSSNDFHTITSSSSQHRVKDKQIFPPRYFVDSHHAVRQHEVFHAIRKLRLSRAHILRWMDSNVSLSHLNGFFLRLRLGKVEGGLGGDTYYVACITGDTVQNVDCKPKKSILVDVGGIKSAIGSQYISNNDFLEDEIKGWWSRLVKTGGNIPTLDELNSKFEDRKRLGL